MTPCIKEPEIKELRDMTIEHRTDFKYIKESLNVMENNHLAHMQASLENMDKRLDGYDQFKYKAMAWAAVGAVVGGILTQLFFKYI